jgi:YegS/Rv2252/BmrU family lipid kinase
MELGSASAMRTRFFVIHNPNAGRETRRRYDATLSSLKRLGGSVEVIDTTRHGEGMRAAAKAARSGRFDAIVAAGGDGTVHDTAEGIIGRQVPLGIIPMGTSNVFAREINLPRSPAQLASTLVEGEARAIPVGQVNGCPFLFVVGIGFDAEAVRLFESAGRRTFGQASFVWPVLRALAVHKDRLLHVQTPRGQADARWVIVTRTKRYAANLMLTPDADLNDPEFHVLRMAGSGPLSRMIQLSALAVGQLRHGRGASVERTSWVRIHGDQGTPVQIDGEVLGTLPLEIKRHTGQLRVVFPRLQRS